MFTDPEGEGDVALWEVTGGNTGLDHEEERQELWARDFIMGRKINGRVSRLRTG